MPEVIGRPALVAQDLGEGWELKRRDPARSLEDDLAASEGWLSARVPGDVYQTLLELGLIPDPFYALNENDVQWVGDADWLYRIRFTAAGLPGGEPRVDLVFEGLDTFATVWLNGKQILQSDDMFLPHRVAIGSYLRQGDNDLAILFESALRRGHEREAEHGPLPAWNGDPSRVYVRKAQYHYGWDWGPTLLTAGPWREVRLEAYGARIADLHCPIEVSPDLGEAAFPIEVALDGESLDGLRLQLALSDPEGQVVDRAEVPAALTVSHRFVVPGPRLWFPRGYGDQPLYTLSATLLDGERALDARTLRLGARRLRPVQEPVAGEAGTSFYFEVNNVQLFAGGANWIPDDSLLTRITPERYRERVRCAAEANMAMLRVWGGGIYEHDAFYDACDELGILVWQDFAFVCGIYPAYPSFLESVRAEAEAQVRRLRHHPSLALWCGNNEDYAIAESIGAYGPGADTSRFPALVIYEELLPEVCGRLDPIRPYWPGSPYGGPVSSDQTIGDRHTWDVWHGRMAPYQDYPRFEGRFVSEFGMQAMPALSTIESFAPPEERYPASRTLEHHNKAGDGPRRLAVYLSDTVPLPTSLENYVYATQLVQAEALRAAYLGYRRRWGKPGGRAVAGALVWQLNDCWPVASWAIVDSLGVAKPAYYEVRRLLAPLALGLARESDAVRTWGMNGTLEGRELTLELRAYTLSGSLLAWEEKGVTLDPNSTTELGRWAPAAVADQVVVFAARLLDGEEVVARAAAWPEPLKYHRFPDPELVVDRLGSDAVRLSVERPAKGVWLEAEGVTFADNFVDLIPGDDQVIACSGLGDEEVTARWLGTGVPAG